MQIQISVIQNLIEIDQRRLKKSAKSILNALGYTETELSITIVNDAEIARLNREFRNVDGPTDVLAFAMHEGDFPDICPEMLGDVVISAPTAKLMAEQHHCDFNAVLDLLLSHGVLHLIGYDHERGRDDAQAMDERTLGLLVHLGHQETSFDWYRTGSEPERTECNSPRFQNRNHPGGAW